MLTLSHRADAIVWVLEHLTRGHVTLGLELVANANTAFTEWQGSAATEFRSPGAGHKAWIGENSQRSVQAATERYAAEAASGVR